jgi:hypothetical protein
MTITLKFVVESIWLYLPTICGPKRIIKKKKKNKKLPSFYTTHKPGQHESIRLDLMRWYDVLSRSDYGWSTHKYESLPYL